MNEGSKAVQNIFVFFLFFLFFFVFNFLEMFKNREINVRLLNFHHLIFKMRFVKRKNAMLKIKGTN